MTLRVYLSFPRNPALSDREPKRMFRTSEAGNYRRWGPTTAPIDSVANDYITELFERFPLATTHIIVKT